MANAILDLISQKRGIPSFNMCVMVRTHTHTHTRAYVCVRFSEFFIFHEIINY